MKLPRPSGIHWSKAFLVLVLAVIPACNASPEIPATDRRDDLTANQVLTQLRAAMDDVESYRFHTRSLLLHGAEEEGSGEWVAPDDYHATFLGAEVIVTGKRAFIRPLTQQEWREVEVPESQFPPYGDFLEIPEMEEVRFLSRFDGDAYRLEGVVVHERVQSPETFRTRRTLIVDGHSFRLREMTQWLTPEQRSPGSFCSTDPEAWGEDSAEYCPHQTITYYDYNAKIEINPPGR